MCLEGKFISNVVTRIGKGAYLSSYSRNKDGILTFRTAHNAALRRYKTAVVELLVRVGRSMAEDKLVRGMRPLSWDIFHPMNARDASLEPSTCSVGL